jgi:inner membrane protein
LLVAVGASLLPDVDSIIGLLFGNLGRFHNNASHSLFVGLAVALAFGAWMRWRNQAGFVFWFLIFLVGYGIHVLMDAATISRGVMALWPLSAERYLSPVIIFYGLHWSDGWLSIRHIWTALTELGFAALVWFLLHGPFSKQAGAKELQVCESE